MSEELRDRLNRLRRSGELHGSDRGSISPRPLLTEFLFPGEEQEQETDSGRCYLREIELPLDLHHGKNRLEESLHCPAGAIALLDNTRNWEGFNTAGTLFLDTETTGLAGGTGTLAFLIGLGWFEEGRLILRQYFLRHPGEERAMLAHFTAEVSRFDSLVTFNGRSFDLPLIQTRQILAGLVKQSDPQWHLDLLYCSRRLWKERLPSCSLRSLEETLLGLKRFDDIPGEEIPAVYFNYLRRGETIRLKQVFQHNVLDILSMITLLNRVTKAATGSLVEHPADYYSLGRIYLQAGETDKAIESFEQAVLCGDKRLEQAALQQLAAAHKKRGRWEMAAALWHELIRRRCFDLSPYLELAKYYEHQAKKLELALHVTTQALDNARRRHRAVSGEQSLPALLHRLNRLRRKLNSL
ncbi:MAG: ribonuclease H-like domain-containing protein [Dethiobacter sp.]|jgi:uncharacterized protein YprB with RNaseH-like and TPR domain|nr:ribonuclease H-like domain-containing protein [Dethiobacter sp.]